MKKNPHLIAHAKKNIPGICFRLLDVVEEPLEEKEAFDHVVLCGVFNAKVEWATENMKSVMDHPASQAAGYQKRHGRTICNHPRSKQRGIQI